MLRDWPRRINHYAETITQKKTPASVGRGLEYCQWKLLISQILRETRYATAVGVSDLDLRVTNTHRHKGDAISQFLFSPISNERLHFSDHTDDCLTIFSFRLKLKVLGKAFNNLFQCDDVNSWLLRYQ